MKNALPWYGLLPDTVPIPACHRLIESEDGFLKLERVSDDTQWLALTRGQMPDVRIVAACRVHVVTEDHVARNDKLKLGEEVVDFADQVHFAT